MNPTPENQPLTKDQRIEEMIEVKIISYVLEKLPENTIIENVFLRSLEVVAADASSRYKMLAQTVLLLYRNRAGQPVATLSLGDMPVNRGVALMCENFLDKKGVHF